MKLLERDDERVTAVEFELTAEDFAAAWEDHLGRSGPMRKMHLRAVLAPGAAFLLAAVLSLLLGDAGGALFWLVGGGVWAAAGPVMLRRSNRIRIRQMSSDQLPIGFLGRHRVELGPEGLRDFTAVSEGFRRWEGVHAVVDRGDHVFVYTGMQAFLPVPGRAFPDGEARRRFVERVRRAVVDADRVERIGG